MTFRLPLLLYVTAVLAAFLATFGQGGLVGFVLWAVFATLFTWGRKRSSLSGLAEAGVVLLIIGLLVALLLPAVQSAREASTRHMCANNLKLMAIGLFNYYDIHKKFPPAHVDDANGKPMHSWRALIVPYLCENDFYDHYDLNEPWDGPNNRKLSHYMPDCFRCPKNANNPAWTTNYVAVIGPHTAFRGSQGRTFNDFRDGTANTILIVETTEPIPWMEPRDITFEEACQSSERPCVSSFHGRPHDDFFFSYTGGETYQATIAHADGSVHYLPGPITPEAMAARLTVDGAELVTDEPELLDIPDLLGPVERHPKWRNILSLAILIALVLMPLVWRPWKLPAAEDTVS
ncbi:MAG: DUF1559 domain-containing protein [Planctomycetales bacterium]|nr:DUF1559 domain-containing protein [Planctomycetales bacterium]